MPTGAYLPICVLVACVLQASIEPSGARAQGLDAQTFTPAPGRAVSLSIPEPELPAHGSVIVGLGLSHARWPLVRAVECPAGATVVDSTCLQEGGRTPLVSDLSQLELSAALALFEAVQVGLVVPGVLTRVADDLEQPKRLRSRAGISDLRFVLDAPLITGATALGAEVLLALPTGDAERLHGEPGWNVRPALVLRQRLGGSALAVQVGYRLRERSELGERGPEGELEVDDQLEAALGLRVPIAGVLEARAELGARFGLGGKRLERNENSIEGELVASLWPEGPFSLLIGGGAGLWSGPSRYGAPLLRGIAIARYAFERSAPTAGASDLCPFQAEDEDGFDDDDGCPDLDDDGDGIPDTRDRCPRGSEDRDGVEDDDGCAELDNDEDEVADAVDACAMDPEDRDGFEDDDGCPEPGPSAASFSVGQERILVSERIYFDFEQDSIRDVSLPVLDGLAEVIRGLSAGTKVLVEGHTDDSGNAAYDVDLSARRARAVMEYLRGRGVPAERLDFVGRGAKQPLARGDSAEARALNRRVEFRLVR